MNQIRDALDDGGALSSGSRRDALTSFSQRHLHGQALSAFLHLCTCCVIACRLCQHVGADSASQVAPVLSLLPSMPLSREGQGVWEALSRASRKRFLLHLRDGLDLAFGALL